MTLSNTLFANQFIGILGGTFDPVHYGHLRSAQAVIQTLNLHRLLLMPCGEPAHRAPPIANAAQRLHMLQLACLEFPQMQIDERELTRVGASYTFDSLQELTHDYPGAQLCLVMGQDAFAHFPTWHRAVDILQLTYIIVMARPNYRLDPQSLADEWYQQHGLSIQQFKELRTRKAGAIIFLETPEYAISSTAIRAYLNAGESLPDHWLPPTVGQWLATNNIYQSF
ncbi:MAG: nicotinate-nucleotide adenylyltransferase [Gammaproteobacteria bacterium]|nr:nicotinate-nucleotide adenylyltransferase [Gammaproteobacteria bacterium]